LWTIALLTASLLLQTPAQACSTCGCSELCALGILQEDIAEGGKTRSLLSESIWGNIILKMAYKRDAKLQGLGKKIGLTDDVTNLGIFCIAGGVLSQVIVNEGTLNPPPPQFDSYLPGSIGLGFSGLTNVVFAGQNVIHWTLKKKIRARQKVLTQEVEAVLHHMEFSETECPEAQKQLAELIGDQAARECEKLWRSSHVMASLPSNPNNKLAPKIGATPSADDRTNPLPANSLSVNLQAQPGAP